MTTKRVYLAGPPYANEYRFRAAALMESVYYEPVNPMVRDFRGNEVGNEAEIVEGDVAEIDTCHAVLADFTRPDEGTAMECWHAFTHGIPIVAYTGGSKLHPWVSYVASAVVEQLDDAAEAIVVCPWPLG